MWTWFSVVDPNHENKSKPAQLELNPDSIISRVQRVKPELKSLMSALKFQAFHWPQRFQRFCASLGYGWTRSAAHASNACWVDIARWLRMCQQSEAESEPEKSKTQLTEFFFFFFFFLGRGRAESKRQERAPPAVAKKRQQKVSNIHTQSKHQTSSNTQNETLWSPWLHRKPASLENPPNVN